MLYIGIILGVALALLVIWSVVRWRRGRALRKGREGERIVAKELSRLKKSENIVLNDLLLPTLNEKTAQIDHLLISTHGIFVIETKSLAGRIVGYEHAQYWQQHLSQQSRSIYNPLLQNQRHVRVVRKILPDIAEEDFVSMIVFTEAWRLDIKADDIIEPRKFRSDRRVQRTFIPEERRKKHWWSFRKEVRLDETQIITRLDGMCREIKRREKIIAPSALPEIAKHLLALNTQSCENQRQHTEYARETSASIRRDIQKGICPRCGGKLIVKKGKQNEFVGCSNYPECRFTCSIDQLH